MDDPTDIFNVVKTLLHVKSTINIFKVLCQLTYTSPKSTIETLEKKCETVNNTNTRTVFLLLNLEIFQIFF